MWTFIDFGIMLVLAIIVVMEVIIPSIQNKPTFPDFRKKTKPKPGIDELVDDLKTKVSEEEVSTEAKITDVEKELTETKEKLTKVKTIKDKTDNL